MRAPTTIALGIALFLGLAAVSCRKVASIDLREAPRLGPEGAPTEIVVFSDFQCGFCKRAAAELERLNHKYPARLEVRFKHYPLEYHEQAVNAARAAEAARRQGKFWEMHDLLFANAGTLTDVSYIDLARRIGLDIARFEKDLAAPETAARVNADKADGDSIGIDGTPFFIINRQPFYGSYGDLERMID